MASRMASASSRCVGNRHSRRLSASAANASGRKCARLMVHGRLQNQPVERLDAPAAAHEFIGEIFEQFGMRRRREPETPKLSGVATSPVPKCCCQTRLTMTRASRLDAGESGCVSHRANARRRPVDSLRRSEARRRAASHSFERHRQPGGLDFFGRCIVIAALEPMDGGRLRKDVGDERHTARLFAPLRPVSA